MRRFVNIIILVTFLFLNYNILIIAQLGLESKLDISKILRDSFGKSILDTLKCRNPLTAQMDSKCVECIFKRSKGGAGRVKRIIESMSSDLTSISNDLDVSKKRVKSTQDLISEDIQEQFVVVLKLLSDIDQLLKNDSYDGILEKFILLKEKWRIVRADLLKNDKLRDEYLESVKKINDQLLVLNQIIQQQYLVFNSNGTIVNSYANMPIIRGAPFIEPVEFRDSEDDLIFSNLESAQIKPIFKFNLDGNVVVNSASSDELNALPVSDRGNFGAHVRTPKPLIKMPLVTDVSQDGLSVPSQSTIAVHVTPIVSSSLHQSVAVPTVPDLSSQSAQSVAITTPTLSSVSQLISSSSQSQSVVKPVVSTASSSLSQSSSGNSSRSSFSDIKPVGPIMQQHFSGNTFGAVDHGAAALKLLGLNPVKKTEEKTDLQPLFSGMQHSASAQLLRDAQSSVVDSNGPLSENTFVPGGNYFGLGLGWSRQVGGLSLPRSSSLQGKVASSNTDIGSSKLGEGIVTMPTGSVKQSRTPRIEEQSAFGNSPGHNQNAATAFDTFGGIGAFEGNDD